MVNDIEDNPDMPLVFEKHFTLDEAIAMLPTVRKLTEETHQELHEIRNGIVLYKRMVDMEGQTRKDLATLLENKIRHFEAVYNHYIDTLAYKGVQVKDVEKGLVDFPYLAKDGTEYLLCWHLGEEGLFYFHELHTGFSGRNPITLLPE